MRHVCRMTNPCQCRSQQQTWGTLLADAMACRSLNYTDLKRVCGSNPILGVCQGFPTCETWAHLESVLGRRP